MNLITSEGLAMIDTNNVIQLRRVHYACPVERPEPRPLLLRRLVWLSYALSALIACMLIGWGYEEISRIDWSAVAQLAGSKR